MKPYYEDDQAVIYNADLRDVSLPNASVDAVVTDPPFFMPADHFQSRVKWQRSWGDVSVLGTFWATTLDSLLPAVKPTGHFLAFCNGDSYREHMLNCLLDELLKTRKPGETAGQFAARLSPPDLQTLYWQRKIGEYADANGYDVDAD